MLTSLGYVVRIVKTLCKGIDYAIHLSGINNYLKSLGAASSFVRIHHLKWPQMTLINDICILFSYPIAAYSFGALLRKFILTKYIYLNRTCWIYILGNDDSLNVQNKPQSAPLWGILFDRFIPRFPIKLAVIIGNNYLVV